MDEFAHKKTMPTDSKATDLVFAYGSNMNLEDLTKWLEKQNYRGERPVIIGAARLDGYRLTWNYWSPVRRGGAANVTVSRADCVWGALLEIEPSLLSFFDLKEGHPIRYDRGAHRKKLYSQKQDGLVEAWVYCVTPEYSRAETCLPTAHYLNLVMTAAIALKLPALYVKTLAEQPCQPG